MTFKKIISLILVTAMVTFLSCNRDSNGGPETPGKITFSFNHVGTSSDGRTKSEAPAFVSYSVKHSSGQVASAKIELFDFNGGYVTQPVELVPGNYELIEFLVLAANNSVIYASPLTGSPLADIVEKPLPLPFTITAEETTPVVPEVIAVEDQEPEEFGYLTFSFLVVEKMDITIKATIADLLQHEDVEYTMHVAAKDAPLGEVRWQKAFTMSELSTISIPAKYDYYIFSAKKEGYIDHVQHYPKSFIEDELSFEFIPASLAGFRTYVSGPVTYYYPDDANRCRLYTRVDVLEGYTIGQIYADRNAEKPNGFPIFGSNANGDCFAYNCGRVNLFENLPYKDAIDYCATRLPSQHDPAQVVIKAFVTMNGYKPNSTQTYISSNFQIWH